MENKRLQKLQSDGKDGEERKQIRIEGGRWNNIGEDGVSHGGSVWVIGRWDRCRERKETT